MAAKRGSAHGFSRSDRVSEQIRRELADLLRFHLKDQRIAAQDDAGHVSAVEVTPDYAHAKVFYTSLADPSANDGDRRGLARSASFLRRELGKRVRIHHMYRNCISSSIASVQEGARLSKLIDEAVESDQGNRDE
jgi:ribosome-binding factor A